MTAFLKHIDLATMRHQRVALPPPPATFSLGVGAGVDLSLPGYEGEHPFRLVNESGPWRLEGETTPPRYFAPGDVLELGDHLIVFLDRPEAHSAELEAAIDQLPEDASRLLVWGDWLQEHGDPLGKTVVQGQGDPEALEGLQSAVDEGVLHLTWRQGVLDTAQLRCIETAGKRQSPGRRQLLRTLARLLTLRVARWMRSLDVDVSAFGRDAEPLPPATTMRMIVDAGPRPALERLSLGYTTQPVHESSFAGALEIRLRDQLLRGRLPSMAGPLRPTAVHAVLEVEQRPQGLELYLPTPGHQVALDAGAWVGGASGGGLAVVPPGVRRPGTLEHFLISAEAPQWHLRPFAPGVRVNGRVVPPIHLLDGDRIEDPSGAVFVFRLR